MISLKSKISEINTFLTSELNDACGDATLVLNLYGLCQKRTVQNDVLGQRRDRTTSIVRPVQHDGTIVTIENNASQQLTLYHLEQGGSTSFSEMIGDYADQKLTSNVRINIAATSIEAIETIIEKFRHGIKNVEYLSHTANTENILRNDFAIDLNGKGYPDGLVAYSIEYRVYE